MSRNPPKLVLLGLILLPCQAWAHGFGGAGILHPLTGLDHLIAMVAVGAWSAQLGGRAIWWVPSAFLVMMTIGGVVGLVIPISGTVDLYIAGSVVLLGAAIAWERRTFLPLAVLGVGVFGFCHGFSHGLELPVQADSLTYVIGFLLTTATLHILGASGGLLLLESPRGGSVLRWAGLGAFVVGIGLVARALALW